MMLKLNENGLHYLVSAQLSNAHNIISDLLQVEDVRLIMREIGESIEANGRMFENLLQDAMVNITVVSTSLEQWMLYTDKPFKRVYH